MFRPVLVQACAALDPLSPPSHQHHDVIVRHQSVFRNCEWLVLTVFFRIIVDVAVTGYLLCGCVAVWFGLNSSGAIEEIDYTNQVVIFAASMHLL